MLIDLALHSAGMAIELLDGLRWLTAEIEKVKRVRGEPPHSILVIFAPLIVQKYGWFPLALTTNECAQFVHNVHADVEIRSLSMQHREEML